MLKQRFEFIGFVKGILPNDQTILLNNILYAPAIIRSLSIEDCNDVSEWLPFLKLNVKLHSSE